MESEYLRVSIHGNRVFRSVYVLPFCIVLNFDTSHLDRTIPVDQQNVGGNILYNKSTHPYMHLLVTSHKKSSVHDHESFKIDSTIVYGTGCPKSGETF